jgi:hypothetical protein
MYDSGLNYTIKTPKQTNHVLHLILTMGTCGAWGFVWLGVVLWNALAKDTTKVQGAWYGQGIARPYAVGPGAPVGPQNPAPSVPPVGMPPMPPYVGYGPSRDRLNMAHPPPSWNIGPGVMVCQHGKPMTDTCLDCPRPAALPQ